MRTKLIEWRKGLGLSQQKAAEILNITQHYLSMLETGKSFPSLDLAVFIEDKTGIPARYFSSNPAPTGK